MESHKILTDLLLSLRADKVEAASGETLDSLPAADVVREVRRRYPVVFQERLIGRKTELGFAKSLQFQLALPGDGGQIFASADLLPIFRNCLLLSTYDDYVSGIAVAKSVRIRPSTNGEGLVVSIGRGRKIDKMPDGWVVKALDRRTTVLSESFLRSRGWKFEVLQPFNRQS